MSGARVVEIVGSEAKRVAGVIRAKALPLADVIAAVRIGGTRDEGGERLDALPVLLIRSGSVADESRFAAEIVRAALALQLREGLLAQGHIAENSCKSVPSGGRSCRRGQFHSSHS